MILMSSGQSNGKGSHLNRKSELYWGLLLEQDLDGHITPQTMQNEVDLAANSMINKATIRNIAYTHDHVQKGQQIIII